MDTSTIKDQLKIKNEINKTVKDPKTKLND